MTCGKQVMYLALTYVASRLTEPHPIMRRRPGFSRSRIASQNNVSYLAQCTAPRDTRVQLPDPQSHMSVC